MVSLLQDWNTNLLTLFSVVDHEMAFGIIFSWATILSIAVFPAAYFLGHITNGTVFYPILVGIQIASLLSLSRFFPGIYAGPAQGYYRIMVGGHIATILVPVILSLGAYFTMRCLGQDYKFQRILVAFCAIILTLKVAFYTP